MLTVLLKSLLRIAAGVALGLPLVLYPYLYFAQERLLFFPQPLVEHELEWARRVHPGAEIELTAPDGTRLHGWYARPDTPPPYPLLMYFGGNAEEITSSLHMRADFPAWALLLVNYRGYGLSAGRPGEQALFQDALFLYDRFAARPEIDRQCIVVMGRSLGTGVAVYLAEQRPTRGVVLVSPYDSITAVAQAVYPYVPVAWLLKHPFDSLSRAPRVATPVLALVGTHDQIIPPAHAERLLAAWRGPVTHVQLPGAGHNDIDAHPLYQASLRAFLDGIAPPPRWCNSAVLAAKLCAPP